MSELTLEKAIEVLCNFDAKVSFTTQFKLEGDTKHIVNVAVVLDYPRLVMTGSPKPYCIINIEAYGLLEAVRALTAMIDTNIVSAWGDARKAFIDDYLEKDKSIIGIKMRDHNLSSRLLQRLSSKMT